MRKLFLCISTMILVVTMVTPALSLVIGFQKEYAGGGAGPVMFLGQDHNQANNTMVLPHFQGQAMKPNAGIHILKWS